MPMPILVTKLHIPPTGPKAIPRWRLVERLNEGLHRKLTLISAPAGFGKTTLVSEWVAASGRPAAWLSLDDADNDPARFLTYLVAALQTVAPAIGGEAWGALQSPQLPPADAVLTTLLNELATLGGGVILVLDDYHAIDAQAIDEAVTFLLEHLPPQVQLVITTREDPRLPLARLRARGHLTELRAADLRFSAGEATEFLNPVMGLNLAAGAIAALEDRTEGWIAGLQLAAISMQGHQDTAGFIQSFTGSHRFVMDYLVDEVLDQQSDRVQAFLLRTSILDQLCGSLCDAVLGDAPGSGQETLEHIERANLFLVPLDDERCWYRYHHLFAELLRQRLHQGAAPVLGDAVDVAALHGRASEWHERNGLRVEAIRHAFAAGDFERAAGLVELSAVGMLGSNSEDMLYGWLTALPDKVVRARPVLSVNYAFAAFSREGLDAAEARLRDAERWLEMAADETRDPVAGEMVVVDDVGYRSLAGTIAMARAYRAGALGDVGGLVSYGQRALSLLPAEDQVWRGAAASILGIGYWTSGDLEPAYRTFAEGKALFEKAGFTQFRNSGVHILADIRIAQGRLCDAERQYTEALRLVAEVGDPIWGTGDLHVGLAELHYERNELAAATQRLQRRRELGDHAGMPDTRHRWYVAMARIRQAEGEQDGALELLDEAERQYVIGPDPVVRPMMALKALIWIAQGRIAEAMGWVGERNLAVDDDLTYLREFEHLTLARVLIARYARVREDCHLQAAIGLLERLLQAAEAGARMGSVIETLAILALAREAGGETGEALALLERALVLAEPERYVRTFVDEGTPMARLLGEAARRGEVPGYARVLLDAFDAGAGPGQDTSPLLVGQPLAEPLSPRELEVLRLIAEGRSNREIGDRLYLALDTVKGHNRRIFGKLGVQSRTEAMARARELGLL